MISFRRPPTLIPTTPWSQPWITWPPPRINSKSRPGRPPFHEASNSLPFLNNTPTYRTATVIPGAAFFPLPAIRSSATSLVGGLPLPFGTFGLVLMLASPAVGVTLLAFVALGALGVVVGDGCVA